MMARLSLLVLIIASVSSTQAQFKSLVVEEVDNKGAVPGRTYRVYAQMEAEGDVIDAVFGDGQDYLEITSTAPFYQHEMGETVPMSSSGPMSSPSTDSSTTAGSPSDTRTTT